MTRTVVVTVATQSQNFPAGPAPAGLVIALINSTGTTVATQPVTAAPYSATFQNVPADTYTATAQAVDVNGNALGALATSTPYEVADLPPAAPQTMAVDVPVSITITAQ